MADFLVVLRTAPINVMCCDLTAQILAYRVSLLQLSGKEFKQRFKFGGTS
jgi:hypothetical protein